MPFKKIGKNKYRRKGRTYTLKQVRLIYWKKHGGKKR